MREGWERSDVRSGGEGAGDVEAALLAAGEIAPADADRRARVEPAAVQQHGGEQVPDVVVGGGGVGETNVAGDRALPPQDGFLFLDKQKFAASFAGDVDPDLAAFMADAQVPWGLEALKGEITKAAWSTKPSWYLVATDDRMIPPDAQRAMASRSGATVTGHPAAMRSTSRAPTPWSM